MNIPLTPITSDTSQGTLGDLTIHVRQLTPTTRCVTLWMQVGWGKNPCGSGMLMLGADGWEGVVEDTVAKRKWRVTGDAELSFERVSK